MIVTNDENENKNLIDNNGKKLFKPMISKNDILKNTVPINNIKNNVEEVPDPKKKKGVAGSGGNDLDEAISLYQEALNVGLKSNYVEELFNILSAKKEEIYKNEITKPVADPKSKLKGKNI